MTEAEALVQAADRYRAEGYEVVMPDKSTLPAELHHPHPFLVARRGSESLFVEVWTQTKLHDLPPNPMPSGWRYDAVILPRPDDVDRLGSGTEATPEFTERLLNELDELVPKGAVRARFLLAWSAAESAMRVAAQREGVVDASLSPRLVVRDLVSAGLISQQQMTQLEPAQVARNRLVHGLPTNDLEPGQIDLLISLARSLLRSPVAAAG
jgi:uncharacterized protein YutE (UPF0331/DUF86 family)